MSHGQPQREPTPGPGPGDSSSLDADVAQLLRRFLSHDDQRAFEELANRFAPHLTSVAEVVTMELGLLADPVDIASEWFSGVFIDTRQPPRIPERPVSEAEAWVRDRAREMVAALAAQPLPWEKGYHDGLCRSLARRVQSVDGVASSTEPPADAEYVYVMNVAFHRLAELERTILRSADVDRTLPADVAERLSMTEDQVIEVMADARSRLEALCQRPSSEDASDD